MPPIETSPVNTPSTAFTLPPTIRLDPLNVRFALSSSSPPVPARTTLPEVRSSTLKVFACPPALISNNPVVVVIPLITVLPLILILVNVAIAPSKFLL